MRDVLRVGLARPQRNARRVERQRRGDRLALELVVDRREVADQISSAIDRAGRQHLHAGDGDAAVVLGDHLQVGIVALLAGEQLGALRMPLGGVTAKLRVEVVPARDVVIAQQILAEARMQPVEQRRRSSPAR